MKIDARTIRLLTEPVREALLGWIKANDLPDAMNILELDVGEQETNVTLVYREPNGNIAVERDGKGKVVGVKQKTFTCRTSTLPGRIRRAFA